MTRTLMALTIMGVAAAQSFEVASIRPSAPGTRPGLLAADNGSLSVRGYTVKTLIQMGWNVRDFEVLGGPSWVNGEGFDVTAQGDRTASDAQLRAMVQALLRDRFQLVLHRESRELPVYALVVGKDGAKIRVSDAAQPDLISERGLIRGTKVSLLNLTRILSRQLDRPLLERTGLAGRYDFDLRWTPFDQVDGDGHRFLRLCRSNWACGSKSRRGRWKCW